MGCMSSISKTADATIAAVPSKLYGIIVQPAAAVATVLVYDHTSTASGDVLVTLRAAANGSSAVFTPAAPVAFRNGIHVTTTGAGIVYQVFYE